MEPPLESNLDSVWAQRATYKMLGRLVIVFEKRSNFGFPLSIRPSLFHRKQTLERCPPHMGSVPPPALAQGLSATRREPDCKPRLSGSPFSRRAHFLEQVSPLGESKRRDSSESWQPFGLPSSRECYTLSGSPPLLSTRWRRPLCSRQCLSTQGLLDLPLSWPRTRPQELVPSATTSPLSFFKDRAKQTYHQLP